MKNNVHPALPPELEASLQELYTTSLPDSAYAAHLEAVLRQRQADLLKSGKRRPFEVSKRQLHSRPLLAVLLALLGLLALSGLVYAVGRLAGFIPGFGFTSPEGTVYVLADMVDYHSGDIELQVRQAVSDGENFWVEISLCGISDKPRYRGAYIMLPDEEKIPFISGADSAGGDGNTEINLLFPALSGNPDTVNLFLKELQGVDVILGLKLRPVQADEMLPVPTEGDLPLLSEWHDGVSLVLDNVALDTEKTIFQVSLRFDRPHTWVASDWNVSLTDGNGVPYPLRDITPASMTDGDVRVYQTVPFHGEEELLLTLLAFPPSQYLPVFIDLAADAPSFTFDAGESPQPGQSWELQHVLSVEGFDMTVIRATLMPDMDYLFEIEAPANVTGVMLSTTDKRLKGSTGGGARATGILDAGLRFSTLPTEPFEVRLMRIYYQAEGTWQIRWQPPVATGVAAKQAATDPTPVITSIPTRTLAASESLLQQVQTLVWKFDAVLQQGPAWVHVVSETRSVPRSGQTFPPPFIRTETWSHIDQEGYVVESVHIDTDEGGYILQQSATRGNYSVNFTTGDTLALENRHLYSLDTISWYVSNALQNGNRILQEEMICENGRRCLFVTLEDYFPLYLDFNKEGIYIGSGKRFWIDLESGRQVKEQDYWLLQDGTEVITMTGTLLLVEVVDEPPQEIVALLERISLP